MRARKLMAALMIVVFAAAGAFAAEPTTRPARQLTPRALLIKRVQGVSLGKMPLMRVLKHYSDLSGLTVNAEWGPLASVGITKETPVTLRARPMRFSKLLDFTLSSIAPRNHPLAWYLSGKQVVVSTQMRVLLRNRISLIRFGRKRAPATRRPAGGGLHQFTFKETPLNMVIEFFRDLSGANFHVNWRAMEATGISKDTPVTLNVRNVSVAQAMDLVLDGLNVGRGREDSVYWIIDQGVVAIATGEVLNRTTKVRTYDISDLLIVVPNFVGPRVNIQNAGDNTGSNNVSGNVGSGRSGGLFETGTDRNTTGIGSDTDEDNIAEQRQNIRDTLIEIIRLSIGDDMWAPTGKGSIRILRNQLIVSQTPLGFKLMDRAFRR